MSAVHDAPSREDRRVVPDGVDATIGAPRGCVWKGVLPENPGRSHQNLLNCALRFTSPCAVTSKPLLCCSESAAAALCSMKALLEATAAIRRVRRIIAHGFRLAALRMGEGASARPSDRPAPQGQAREPRFAADFLFVTRPTRRVRKRTAFGINSVRQAIMDR